MWSSSRKNLPCSTQTAASKEPIGFAWRSHRLFILCTVTLALFTDLFLYGLVIPILPFMLSDGVGIPPSKIQSYTSAMLAAFAAAVVVVSPLAGFLADRIRTRRTPFLIGLVYLLGATLLLFLGKSVGVLIAARVLQGVSSAIVWTLGLAICIETVGPDNMGKTMGTIFSVVGLGTLWAPFIGGVLYEKTGMQGVMGVAVGIIGVDLVLRLLLVEKKSIYEDLSSDEEEACPTQERDHEEQPLLQGGKCMEQYKLAQDQAWIVRAVPILPCLADSSLLTALVGSLVQAVLMGSFDATVTTVSHDLFGFDAFQAGILFLPLGLTNLVFGPVIGCAVDRYGTKVTAVTCFGIFVPILASLRFVHAGGMPQILLYAALLALAGIGVSGTGTPSIVEAGAVIDKYHKANLEFFGAKGPYAMVYGMNGMVFNAGLSLGPELAGELKERIGYGNMNLVLAAVSGATALLCFFFMGGRRETG